MGQDDFSKKQNDICKFVEKFCRESNIENLDEDKNWRGTSPLLTGCTRCGAPSGVSHRSSVDPAGHVLQPVLWIFGQTHPSSTSVWTCYTGFYAARRSLAHPANATRCGSHGWCHWWPCDHQPVALRLTKENAIWSASTAPRRAKNDLTRCPPEFGEHWSRTFLTAQEINRS